MVEAHGQDWQKVMRLQCAENDNVYPMVRGRSRVRYSTSVISVCRKNATALSVEFNHVRSVKCGKETVYWVLLKHPLITVQWSQRQSSKEMAAIYIFRKAIYWGSSCLILRLKIITLLQMKRVQTISRRPYCRTLHFSDFLTSNIFFPTSADAYSRYLFFLKNEQKHSTLTLSNSLIALVILPFVKFYS